MSYSISDLEMDSWPYVFVSCGTLYKILQIFTTSTHRQGMPSHSDCFLSLCIEDQLLFCAEINAPYIDSGATELHLLRPYRAYSEHGVKMQVNLETLTIVNQVIFLISSSSSPSSPSCSVCSLQYSSLKK